MTIHEAKTNLSKLIARAEAGEKIVIVRNKEPVALLTALPKSKKSLFGALAGRSPNTGRFLLRSASRRRVATLGRRN